MPVVDIIRTITWRDAADIIFLTIVAYQLFVWFRGTRALRVLIGLVVLGGIYSAAKFWGLLMTTWVFQILWQVLVILLILFQSEIRQVLERVSPLRFLRAKRAYSESSLLTDLPSALFDLAETRTGAIIVLAREDNLKEFLHAGQPLMAIPTVALIKSIFNVHAPAHDGAVVIEEGRLAEMGAFLPLTEREDVPEQYGSRHRAAIGLAERTDAVCLVVSEERGQVSSVVGAEIRTWENKEALAARLRVWLGLTEPTGPTLSGFLRGLFVENWAVKLGAFLVVALSWLVVAGTQEVRMNLDLPLAFSEPDAGLAMAEASNHEVSLTVGGSRRAVAMLDRQKVAVHVKVSDLPAGTQLIRLSPSDVDLPLGLTIERVWPQNITVVLRPVSSRSADRPNATPSGTD